MPEVTGKQIVGGLLIGVFVLAFLQPAMFEQYTGIKLGDDSSESNSNDGVAIWQEDDEEEVVTPPVVEPPVTRECLKHTYTLGSAANPVGLYIMDKLNPKSGISGLEMEVLNIPALPYTLDKVFAIASNPMRSVVDEDTSTSAAGLAEFASNTMLVYMDYIFSLRGDSNVYDKAVVRKLPCVPPEREGYTFPDRMYAYKVGNFSALYSAATYSVNISGLSGTQYETFDITIGENVAGNATKDPVLVLRSPEDYELEPGDIVSMYIIRKDGTEFGIPGIDLTDYITGETPIPLKGSIYDEDYGKYLMTVADSGTYTVKLTYDADQIQTTGDRLMIAVDDLGCYRCKDDVTKGVKATAATVTIQFVT